LKSLVTMAGPDVICVGAGKESQEVLKVSHNVNATHTNCESF